ncbi:hypothetical protein T484DRAFT_1803358 [Baffinella frigidus]|nr:hypothetical protein T484DRAFT_1803358 [Cryptophyta sp. CCMP2293]
MCEVPNLLPGPVYKLEIPVTCIDRNGGMEAIQLCGCGRKTALCVCGRKSALCVCGRKSAVPTLAAVIDMPLCDPLED